MRDRLSPSGYGNKLDCSPTRGTQTVNGAKKNDIFSSSIFSSFLLGSGFTLLGMVVYYNIDIFSSVVSLAKYTPVV